MLDNAPVPLLEDVLDVFLRILADLRDVGVQPDPETLVARPTRNLDERGGVVDLVRALRPVPRLLLHPFLRPEGPEETGEGVTVNVRLCDFEHFGFNPLHHRSVPFWQVQCGIPYNGFRGGAPKA